jgi:thiol-disulfide isomerase/thioredoxin
MAKSKRPQQPKRIGQSQPEGVTRATGASKASASTTSKTPAAVAPAASKASSAAPTASSGSSPSRLNAMRERTATSNGAQPRRPVQRARYAQAPWWRRNMGALIVVGVVVVLVGAFIGFANFQNKQAAAGIGDPAPDSIMKTLTTIPASEFATVGTGSTTIQVEATSANTPMLRSGGKPEVVYVGAEYCPYCASERWSTVIALSRFGTFKGLELMRSSSTDTRPNTPTLSFRDATYSSKYITFSMTEGQDRNGNPLATPPADISQIFSQYDQAPYTQSAGSIPFMSFGNQYVTIGAPYDPQLLAGLNWQDVADQLKDPTNPSTQAILSTANYQTAAICKLTNNQPSNVCNTPVIQQIEAKLPAAQ